MDYEDMIEDEPKLISEAPEAEVELDPIEEPRAKSPWKAFILTGLLAGLIGAGGGGYGAYTALKKLSPTPVAQVEVDLSPIEAKLKRLTDRMSAVEGDVQDVANRPSVDAGPVDLSAVEDRLTALESAPAAEIDPEALTALQAAREDGFEWPDVSELENRITGLETKEDTPSEATLPEDLMDRLASLESEAKAAPEDMMDRLSALETDMETVQNAEPEASAESEMMVEVMSKLESRLSALENRPAPKPVVERVSILAFPKIQMVGAAEANMEGGMIKKTLSRHIRVKDTNDPLTLIDGIESDLSEGRLAAAAEKFERLPSPVRAAGQAWYESVKASL